MMNSKTNTLDKVSNWSTEELKNELLKLTQGRDKDTLNKKVRSYDDKLALIFEELSYRNPIPNAEDQLSLVQGV